MERGSKQRLIEFIEHLSMTVGAFEKSCGLSNGCLRNNHSGVLSTKTKEKIKAAFPELNMFWLTTGVGEMYNKPNAVIQNNVNGDNYQGCTVTAPAQEPTPTAPGENEEYAEVEEITGAPVLPPSMHKAGNTDLLDFVQTAKNVGRSGIEVAGLNVDMCVYVRDEALTPHYEKGDLVALQAYEDNVSVIPGRIYGINTKSNGMQLRILLTEDPRLGEGDYLARSFNPESFPDYVIRKDDIITIFKKLFLIRY